MVIITQLPPVKGIMITARPAHNMITFTSRERVTCTNTPHLVPTDLPGSYTSPCRSPSAYVHPTEPLHEQAGRLGFPTLSSTTARRLAKVFLQASIRARY